MKKNKTLVLILGILLAAALAVGLWFGVKALTKGTSEKPAASGTPGSSETPEGETGTTGAPEEESGTTGAPEEEDPAITAVRAKDVYTEEDLAAGDARLDEIVASCGDYEMDNKQAQIYYFMQYYSFMSQYGAYAEMFGITTGRPLAEQVSMVSDISWEQYFLMAAMDQFQQFAAAATRANAEGYVMSPEEQADLEDILSGLDEEAAYYNFESVDAYLQDSFGPTVGFEDYEAYLRLYFQAMSYENDLYLAITPSEQELQAYYEAHSEDYEGVGQDQTNINVRHILFLTDADEDGEVTDEEYNAAKTRAEEILEGFLTNPSEEYFAELANENSEDPGSNTNGGLYEDVYPGQMVDTFNDWCFDAARQSGDTGIVETSYGFHVMYFVSHTDTYYWKEAVTDDIRMELMNDVVEEILAAYPLTTHYEKVVLAPFPGEAME